MDADTLFQLMKSERIEKIEELGGQEAILEGIGTHPTNGLPSSEANSNFAVRKEKFGENKFKEARSKTLLQLFLEALKDTTLIVLMVSAVISLVLGLIFPGPEGRSTAWIEGGAILLAVFIIACVTAGNNYSKEKQFQALNKAKDNFLVKVIRAGQPNQISMLDVLVGDIIELSPGDKIPADGLFISGFDMRVDQSSLTGEPEPVKKDLNHPFLFSGCIMSEGYGKMVALCVGDKSRWGSIIASLTEEPSETPLQQQLEDLAKKIGKVGVVVGVLVFLALTIVWAVQLGLSGKGWQWSQLRNLIDFFIIGMTILVVAVPEGLPLAITISLAYSVKQMMKDNNLVRQLIACETMGGATNICSDKTGTLTENRMSVRQGWICGTEFDKDKSIDPSIPENMKSILAEGIICNTTADVVIQTGQPTKFLQSATECALIVLAADYVSDYREIRAKYPPFKRFPFSSAKKRMSTIVKVDNGFRLYTKGAAEIVLKLCSSYVNSQGAVVPLSEDLQKKLFNKIDTMADLALRTMCLAYREFEQEDEWNDAPEENLICIGIVGIRDPLRKEVPLAVEACQRAGIFVRMVTGDNIKTAKRIATDCGILSSDGLAMEGPDFETLTDDQVDQILPRLQVLARCSPEHKLRLVKRLMANGEVVAVTGDGTNDAPALKAADVGLSMGISGTEVAKEASKIVILDDNFNSIKSAVLWGRCIYDNIRKFLQFQLTINVVALVVAFIGALSERGTPLKAVQLLWVNLIMDTMGALALATEKPTPDLLLRKPYGRGGSLISPTMYKHIIGQGLFQLAVLFTILYSGQYIWDVGSEGSFLHYTILFNTFVFCQVFNEINCRKVNDEFNIIEKIWTNYMFVLIIVITIIVQFLIVQFLGDFAQTAPLDAVQWFSCIGIAALSIPLSTLLRAIPIGKTASEMKPNPNQTLLEEHKVPAQLEEMLSSTNLLPPEKV